ncbi:MAG: SDR family NAD(P)-dependent oxidoreductase [Myxococcota bacterium]
MELRGRRVLVTGANTGIGRIIAVELAKKGARLVLANRSRARSEAVLAELSALGLAAEPELVEMDLAHLDSVRKAAMQLREGSPFGLIVNNAGLAGHRGQTEDGFELAFGVNHLGPYLLTRSLLEHLESPARIVNVASKAHERAKGIDWAALTRPTRSVTGVPEYEVSKLANVLFTLALHRRLPDSVRTYAVHPGVVRTEIWRRIPQPVRWFMTRSMISPEEGAEGPLLLCSEDVPSGSYYHRTRRKAPNPVALDEALQEELWRRSAAWVGITPD